MNKFFRNAHLSSLPDEEHNKFASDLCEMITKSNSVVRQTLVNQFSVFTKLVEKEDRLIKTLYNAQPTYKIKKTDNLRTGLFRALQAITTAYTYSPAGWVSFTAKELSVIFDKFNNIYTMPIATKTATICSLLQKLEAYAESCNRLHITNLISDLANANALYETLCTNYMNTDIDKKAVATMEKIRLKVDVIYSKIIIVLERAMLMDGIKHYSDFVIKFNTYVDTLRRRVNRTNHNAMYKK